MDSIPEEVKTTLWGGFRYTLISSDGEPFQKEDETVRTFDSEGKAIGYLRKSGYPWIVTKCDNSKVYVNCLSPEEEGKYGPHVWEKRNLFTISDRSGYYNLMRCEYCHKEVKCFGFNRPAGGICEKHLLGGNDV